ncbi:NAD(P)-dependent oxidoreductase [Alkalihalobacillus deserti]
MKSTAFLINVSRDGILHKEGSHFRVKQNQIKGAAIDVFEFDSQINE